MESMVENQIKGLAAKSSPPEGLNGVIQLCLYAFITEVERKPE